MRSDDFHLVPIDLPMEDQMHRTYEQKRAKLIRELYDDPAEPKLPPLTTNVYARGYPPTEAELKSVRLINEMEQKILEDPSRSPKEPSEKEQYFIIEDGRVFKTNEEGIFYNFLFDRGEWDFEPSLIILIMDNSYKFSKLKNFRDYYPEIPIDF